MSSPAAPIPTSNPWGQPAVAKPSSPWGSLAGSAPKPCSLQDVMSEELAKELLDQEETKAGMTSEAACGSPDVDLRDFVVVDEDSEVLKDFLLAQSLQDQFDTEQTDIVTNVTPKETDPDLLLAHKLQAELDAKQSVEVWDASTGEVTEPDSDLLLAQMLQHEFDREHDDILKREENKLNGTSKVTLNFAHYRSVHPALEESDESEDEADYLWEEKPKKDATPQFKRGTGISGKGKNIITKHDPAICGRKNATRAMDRFPPDFMTGDGSDIDMKLSNKVYNTLKNHSESVDKRSRRLHDKKEHSTAGMAMDEKTRLILYKMVNSEVLDNVNGVISAGKEAVVFHADGGSMTTELVPSECAIKVFKTTLNEFRNRTEYMRGDYRFVKENADFRKLNPRIIIKMWAQKEEQNLRRLETAGVPVPHVVMLHKHVLVMSFIGKNQRAAPKLRDAKLSTVDMQIAYEQTLDIMKKVYNDARLVHSDFSEYNLLWHDDRVVVIDVSQSVERHHPQAMQFLLRDCRNISDFFKKNGVPNVPDKYKLFNDITGLDIKEEEEELFMKKLQDYEKNEEKLRIDKCKSYPFDHFFNEAKREREETQRKLEERLNGSDSESSSEDEVEEEEGTGPSEPSTSPPADEGATSGKSDHRGNLKHGKVGKDKKSGKSASPSVRFKDADQH